MHLTPRVVAVTCALALFCAPLSADVIPVQVESDREQGDRAVVVEHLSGLGITGDAAERMTPDVAAHFAAHPEALQVVAGLHAEELLVGMGYIIILGAITAQTLQKKR